MERSINGVSTGPLRHRPCRTRTRLHAAPSGKACRRGSSLLHGLPATGSGEAHFVDGIAHRALRGISRGGDKPFLAWTAVQVGCMFHGAKDGRLPKSGSILAALHLHRGPAVLTVAGCPLHAGALRHYVGRQKFFSCKLSSRGGGDAAISSSVPLPWRWPRLLWRLAMTTSTNVFTRFYLACDARSRQGGWGWVQYGANTRPVRHLSGAAVCR